MFKNFENFEYPWGVEANMVLLLGIMNVVQILFTVKQLFVSAPTPVTRTAATQSLVMSTVVIQTLARGIAATQIWQ